MRCPECGSEVADGSASCPVCLCQLGLTQRIPVAKARWCPTCGALVSPGKGFCPKCGTPLAPERGLRKISLPPIPDAEESDGQVPGLPSLGSQRGEASIESAIPAELDPASVVVRHDRIPRTRAFLIAGALAVAVVGGITLAITHPWDPSLYDLRATQGADTTKAGFPGTIDALKGQDDVVSGSSSSVDTIYRAIADDYTKLGTLADELDEAYAAFDGAAYGTDATRRQKLSDDATQLSLDISNLVADIHSLDDGGGVYAVDLANMSRLGSWLRNRADALTAAWGLVSGHDDPDAVSAAEVRAVLQRNFSAGRDSFKTLFDENYGPWAPRQQ